VPRGDYEPANAGSGILRFGMTLKDGIRQFGTERFNDEFQASGTGMGCNFVVEPKVGVDDRKFSVSQRTDRE
jgi:hypothetical protein